MSKITNLFFGGGGVRVVSYLGSLETLLQHHFINEDNIIRVGGSSAGAIAAMFMSLGYRISEMRELLLDMDFKKFMVENSYPRKAYNLYNGFGCTSSEHAENFIEGILYERTKINNITFAQLHELRKAQIAEYGVSEYRDLYVVVTNLQKIRNETWSHESHQRDMPIAKALSISMSIPLFFIPQTIDGDLFVDGELMAGHQIHIFDHHKYFPNWDAKNCDQFSMRPIYNPHTLGFRVMASDEDPPPINSLSDKIECMAIMYSRVQSQVATLRGDDKRTVRSLSLNYKATDFHITRAERMLLLRAGKQAAISFLKEQDHNFSQHKILRRSSSQLSLQQDYPLYRFRIERSEFAKQTSETSSIENNVVSLDTTITTVEDDANITSPKEQQLDEKLDDSDIKIDNNEDNVKSYNCLIM